MPVRRESGRMGGWTAFHCEPQRYAEKCKNALCIRFPLWLIISYKFYIFTAMAAIGNTKQEGDRRLEGWMELEVSKNNCFYLDRINRID